MLISHSNCLLITPDSYNVSDGRQELHGVQVSAIGPLGPLVLGGFAGTPQKTVISLTLVNVSFCFHLKQATNNGMAGLRSGNIFEKAANT